MIDGYRHRRVGSSASGRWNRSGARSPSGPTRPLHSAAYSPGPGSTPASFPSSARRLASADRVDILCSFIKWSGIRILEEDLRAFTARPSVRLRILTTSYLGATDLKAVDLLESLPSTEVRVSYDTHRTRLHAKAYLFHRDSNFGTAYVGSANLSRPALTEGLEWTVKLSQYESPHLWDRVAATFETYWEDREFEPYQQAERPRLKQALEDERSADSSGPTPFPYRATALAVSARDPRPAARRTPGSRARPPPGRGGHRHGQDDDRRVRLSPLVPASNSRLRPAAAAPLRRPPRGAAPTEPPDVSRAVLRDPNFGDLLVGGREPSQFDHLFVSIQSYQSRSLHELPADRYEYVVVDEFHHAAAPSYERLLDHVRPRVLLGLTATPERSDGLDVLDVLRRTSERPDPAARRDQPQAALAVPVLRCDRQRRPAAASNGSAAATGSMSSTGSSPAMTCEPPL